MGINDVIGEPVEIERDEAPAAEAQASEAEPQQSEQSEAQPPEQQQTPPEHKTVPLPALHEERAKRRELQAQLQAEREARAQLEARVEQRIAQLQAAMAPKQEVPTIETDPVGHLKHSLDQVRNVALQTNQQVQTWQQRQHAEQQLQAAAARVQAIENQFVAIKPDYHDALGYYRDQRTRELVAMGADEDTAQQQVGRELMEGAIYHAMNGRNAAEIAYRLAEARGYKPRAPVTDATKIELQQKGQAAAKTLGSGSPAKGLDTKALLEMSDEDFNKATKGDHWRRLMGG